MSFPDAYRLCSQISEQAGDTRTLLSEAEAVRRDPDRRKEYLQDAREHTELISTLADDLAVAIPAK